MLTIAVIFISTALLLYSTAIWSERIIGVLKLWMIRIFISAFVCDLLATSLMAYQATTRFELNAHSRSGYIALGIMGLHFIWAIIAIRCKGQAEKYFHRFSLLAWLIWLAAFISGVPKVHFF
ncbi:MAG: HsmA family protein [Patescibacteria group bacterium]